jgi:hypothetical protein
VSSASCIIIQSRVTDTGFHALLDCASVSRLGLFSVSFAVKPDACQATCKDGHPGVDDEVVLQDESSESRRARGGVLRGDCSLELGKEMRAPTQLLLPFGPLSAFSLSYFSNESEMRPAESARCSAWV